MTDSHLDEILTEINLRSKGAFRLVGKLPGGHQSGAYELVSHETDRAVLKITPGAGRFSILEKVQPLVETMRQRGYPMPELIDFGVLSGPTWSVRTFVEGVSMTHLNQENLPWVLDLIGLQAECHLETDRDWSRWVSSVLSGREQNYPESLTGHERKTRELWNRITSRVKDPDSISLSQSDWVHGDFSLSNIIVSDDTVDGVIDYEYGGSGTRVIDLATILEYAYIHWPDPWILETLWAEGRRIAGEVALGICLLYRAVEMVYWFIFEE